MLKIFLNFNGISIKIGESKLIFETYIPLQKPKNILAKILNKRNDI